ncbi:MAG TPA: LysM peptidoglycan-binding domain-containing protein [Anaerolineaceae bacterium]|nr:LysM peptidoglycan-binding domain-containing protein [Anaerolineaceae bacterium]
MKKTLLFLCVVLVGLIWLATLPAVPVSGAPAGQIAFQTPTPGPDGRILYTVKQGDTCISISLLTGVSVDELRKLNNLKPDCTLQLGSQLLLGLAGPAETTPTPGPAPTATPLLPSPTPKKGTGDICILLFEDVNGDGQRQDTEGSIPNGQISVIDRSGSFSKTATTTDSPDPICYDGVEEGEYNISVAVPQGYNSTTPLNFTLLLGPGDQDTLDFGAQKSSALSQPGQGPASGGGDERSPMLGVLGGVILLAGVGLWLYMRLLKR